MGLTNHIKHKSGKMKTVCTSHVLSFFGIDSSTYHYASDKNTVSQILRRNGYSVRSRNSIMNIKVYNTIGKLRKKIKTIDGNENNYYYVGVVGHAMVLNGIGKTIVDTAERLRDRRRVTHINIVSKKLIF